MDNGFNTPVTQKKIFEILCLLFYSVHDFVLTGVVMSSI